MTVRLRPWSPGDLPALTALRENAKVQEQLMASPKPGDVMSWLERRGADARGEFWVIDEAGSCCGFVQLTEMEPGDCAWLGVCVAPDRQGRGLGAHALELLEHRAAAGLHLRRLMLKVLATNTRAVELYRRRGYRERERERSGTVLVMEKPLTATASGLAPR